ncbi:putative disease resistance RPP13 protein 1 [Spatholobus suberectus]|nr:putative disease resistance RPP13 protein 1 [Spatholobus suberectus]
MKLRWGELEEEYGEDLDFFLLSWQVIGLDEKDIRKVIEYKFDEDGNKVKITTTMHTRKLASACLSKHAVKRRSWPKFSNAIHKNVYSRLTMEEAETAEEDYEKKVVSETLAAIILGGKNEGNVLAFTIRGIIGMQKAGVAKCVCEAAEVKSGFDVVSWIDGFQLQEYYAESVVDRVNHLLEEAKKKDSGVGKGFFVVLDDFHNENHEEWLKLAVKLKEVARTSSGGAVLLVTTRSKAVVKFVTDSFGYDLGRECMEEFLRRSIFRVNENREISIVKWRALSPPVMVGHDSVSMKKNKGITDNDVRLGCKDLKSIEGWKHLTSLEKLHISNCTGIDLPGEEWEGLEALQDLIIEDMPKLEYLPERIKRLASKSLTTLEIESCPELKTMLDFGEDLYSVTFILIEDCPKLASLPNSFKANRFFTPLRT